MADVIDSTAEEHKPGPAPSSTGYSRLIAALIGGLVGGLIVLIIGWLLLPQYVQGRIDQGMAGLQPDPGLEQRIAAAEQRIEPLSGLEGTTTELSGKVASLESGVSELSGLPAKVDETEQRLGAIDLGSLQTGQQELSGRIETLEQKPEPSMPDIAPLQAAIDAAQKNADDLRSVTAQLGNRVNDVTTVNDATARRVDTLTAAQAEAERRLTERAQQLADRLAANDAAISSKFNSLTQAEATLAALQSAIASQASQVGAAEAGSAEATAKAEEALVAAKEGVASVEQRVNEQLAQDERGIATAVALTDLNKALEVGGSFPAAQAVLETSSDGDGTIARAAGLLRTSAAQGVASRSDLLAELEDLDDVGVTASSDDWVEQTRENILGLVTVKRRDGAAPSEDAAGGSDAAAKLAAGDLSGAIAAVAARPDAGSEPVAGWLARAKARADAEEAAGLLRQHLGELLVQPG